MVRQVKSQDVPVPEYQRIILDSDQGIDLVVVFTQGKVELVQAGFGCIADVQVTETDVVFQDLLPVVVASVDADRFLQGVSVELFVTLWRERQFIKQIGSSVEQGGDALGSQQLGIGLAVDQKVLHFRQVEIAEPGNNDQREAHQDEQLGAEAGTADGIHVNSAYLADQR